MSMLDDARFGLRLLLRQKSFTIAAIAAIALGMGATTAVFSLVDAVLLRPLPFPEPGRLVRLYEIRPDGGNNSLSPENLLDWKNQSRTLRDISWVLFGSGTLTDGQGAPEFLNGLRTNAAYFAASGVQPVAGRVFSAAEEDENLVVISEGLWERRYARSPSTVGRGVQIDGRAVTIIGILPRHFEMLHKAEFWAPANLLRNRSSRKAHFVRAFARLAPNATIAQADAEAKAIAAQLAIAYPESNQGWSARVIPLRDSLVSTELRATTRILFGVVAFLLLIACANVANLLLAAGSARAREMTVRAALGASPRRILSQLLTESLMLSAAGGLCGLTMAAAILRLAPAALPAGTLPAGVQIGLDARVLAFAVAAILLTAIAFGLLPAWQAARSSLSAHAAARGFSAGGAGFRNTLAAVEIALAVVLLAGSGLLVRTLLHMISQPWGLDTRNTLTFALQPAPRRYNTPEKLRQFYEQLIDRLERLPGARSAGMSMTAPMLGSMIYMNFEVAGQPPKPSARQDASHLQIVSSRYFDSVGMRLVEGRAFSPGDRFSSPAVAIVNRHFADRFLHGAAVGKRILVANPSGPVRAIVKEREVVGVVADIKVEGPTDAGSPEIYLPITQEGAYNSFFAIRTDGADPLSLTGAVREAVRQVDSDIAISDLRTLDEVSALSMARPRFRAVLVAAFAAIALALAAFGVYGVLAYSVNRRSREFGIRLAVGARPWGLARMVLRDALLVSGAGVAAGIAAAAALSRGLDALLYGIQPRDPVTFTLVPLVLLAASLAAALIPAFRASRVDPVLVLRQD
ncbi:MAG: ABC transporter permease [Bryobacteraceae bacterium]|nr:ABC transporter permease [Bryobacteraceae bacterium]